MTSLDWPTFGNALWQVSDQLGIRPEWQLPVLGLETGGTFDPAIMNQNGCVGINQFCPQTYPGYVSVPVSQYRTWPASAQLSGPVLAYWRNALKYGPIRSATRLMLSQFGQGLLAAAPALDSVVFQSPSQEYVQNAGLDTAHKGSITVQDIANAMSRQAQSPSVVDAISRAYAMRPTEKPRDAVYGYDYMSPSPSPFPGVTPPARPIGTSPVLVTVGALAMTAAAGFAAYLGRRGRREAEPEPEPEPFVYP